MHFFAKMWQQDWIYSLGWTLLHSLWQHALIAFLCALLLFFARTFSSNTRYLIALASLLLGMLVSAITFYQYQQASITIILRPATHAGFTQFFNSDELFSLAGFINHYLDNIVFVWLCGFLAYALKAILDYRYCQSIKNQQIIPTPEKWLPIFAALAQQVGIKTRTELRISTFITIPCVIGSVKPVVLLPAAVLLGMSQAQVEAILLHELAHIRRQDYLISLLQAIARAGFFFNPFLHWISHQIDKEREYACDDIAVTITKNPLLFANTLKEFAEMSINQKNVLRITGNKMLLNRVVRLFKSGKRVTPLKQHLLSSVFIVFSSVAITLCVHAAPEKLADKKISLDAVNVSVQKIMTEINQKCSTNETIATTNDQLSLQLEDIPCSKAIQLVKDFASGSSAQEKPAQ